MSVPPPPLLVSILYSAALGCWLHFVFMYPLKGEAFEMHERQLDPTEIIAIPIPVERLFVFVMAVAWIVVVTASSCSLVSKLVILLQWSAALFVVMILSGASPTENIYHTSLAAIYLASLILWDLAYERSPPKHLSSSSNDFLWRVSPTVNGLRDEAQEPRRRAWMRAHGALVVTIFFQIFLLYDRGWQVQRWPVPTILGASVGWIVGSFIGSTPLGSLLWSSQASSHGTEQDLKTT